MTNRRILGQIHPLRRNVVARFVLPFAAAAAIFAFDLAMPLGVAAGIPYVLLVLMGLWSPRRSDIFLFAATATGLVLAAIPLSGPAPETWMAMTNRALSLIAIWITAVLSYRERRMRERSHDSALTALAESETVFRSLADSAPFVVIIKDPDGHVIYTNQRFEADYGVAPKTTKGKRSAELYPPEAAALLESQDREVMETRGPVVREINVFDADGSPVTKVVTKFPIFSGGGELLALGGIGTDVTEQRAAEKALRISEERFRRIFDDAGIGVWLTDTEGRLVETNRAVCDFLGYREGELIGKTNVDITHPDDVASTRARVAEMTSGTARRMTTEKRFLRKDGRTVWAISNVAPIKGADGKLQNVIVALQDITARKLAERALRESEERNRVLTQTLPDGILVTKQGGQIVYANPSALALFGADSPNRIVGRDMLDFVHPDDRDDVRRIRRDALNGIAPHIAERRRIRLDGSEFISQSSGALINWDGQPAIVIIIRDITEQRRTEEQLRQAQKMESVGQLTGGIAHDFNNLLTVIQGNAELLDSSEGAGQRFARNILRAAGRGAELTQRLLAYSRRQPLDPHPLDIGRITGDMAALLGRMLGEAVEIVTRAGPGMWPANADAGQVENAILNLAINARDAMPRGGRLTIACANSTLDEDFVAENPEAIPGEYVEVRVTDTGEGMTPEVLARVFDPFFTTKDVGKGSGLGLSMVYGFARQSGGFVTVESAPGKGTSVRLLLPRANETEARAGDETQDAFSPPGHGESILLLEDDPEVRELTQRMLERLGYRVAPVATAADAKRHLATAPRPDLVLSDVVLPGGTSGPAFVREARATLPGLRVVFMSGYSADAFTDGNPPAQDAILLNKPFTLEQLAQAVRDTLSRAQRR